MSIELGKGTVLKFVARHSLAEKYAKHMKGRIG